MKKKFKYRIEAIDWLAGFAENEGQFEVLREQLNYNFIYFGEFFIKFDKMEDLGEVVFLGSAHGR